MVRESVRLWLIKLASQLKIFANYSTNWNRDTFNTSQAALWALPHHLQCRNAYKTHFGCQMSQNYRLELYQFP